MTRRPARQARILGLWSASWLALLLVAGLLWLGDLTAQWPVLLVPGLWALVAVRRRPERGHRDEDDSYDDHDPDDDGAPYGGGYYDEDRYYDDGRYDEGRYDEGRYDDGYGGPHAPLGERTDTVERPAVRTRRGRPGRGR